MEYEPVLKHMVLNRLTDADEKHSYTWLRNVGQTIEGKCFILAAQNHIVLTQNYQTNVINDGTSPKFPNCHGEIETVDHPIEGVKFFIERWRDSGVDQHVYKLICWQNRISAVYKWDKDYPASVTEAEKSYFFIAHVGIKIEGPVE